MLKAPGHTRPLFKLQSINLLIAVCICGSPSIRAQKGIAPTDPFYPEQISFHGSGNETINDQSYRPSSHEYQVNPTATLDIERAWAITTGSKGIVVAIVDDGFCYDMPDVRDNLWHNPGESGLDSFGFPKETNGKDDDGNGYKDDVIGWDFVFNTADPTCYVFDGMDRTRIAPYWHSLHAMGIIGAKGNNGIGIAGINWNVSMMLLRIGVQGVSRGDEMQSRNLDHMIQAIRYAADNGARVLNISYIIRGASAKEISNLKDAISYAARRNLLIVVAAGNDKQDLDDDSHCGVFPQCLEAPNLVKVAESDLSGGLYKSAPPWVAGSNYGRRRVEIAAIGSNYTTGILNGMPIYEITGGTSNAAPVVSGVAALMLSVNSSLTAAKLKELLMQNVTPIPALRDKVTSGGVINAYRSVLAASAERN